MAETTSSLNSDESAAPLIVGVTIGLTSLSSVLTALRLFTRMSLKTQGLDDAAIGVAQILTIGLAVSVCLQVHFGLGRHVGLLSQEDVVSHAKWFFAVIQTYIWSLCIVKVALLLQYRRVFSVIWVRTAALAVIVFTIIWNILQSILCTLACIPVSIFVPSRQGHCIDGSTVWLAAAFFNISTDFIVFALPLPAIAQLHLPVRQKVVLFIVFCLGFFTCIVSIVRVRSVDLIKNDPDYTWVGQAPTLWTITEINCALCCACLPVLKPLISRLFPGLLSSIHSNRPNAGYGSRPAGSYVLRPTKKIRTVRTGSTEALRGGTVGRPFYGNTQNIFISGGGEGSSIAEAGSVAEGGSVGEGEGDRHMKESQDIRVTTEMVDEARLYSLPP